MIDGKKTEGSPKTVWATTGAPKHLQRRDNARAVGTHEGLRSARVDKKIPREGIDEWCYRSIELVAAPFRTNAANQRRIRYFGFEAAHDTTTES